MIVRPMEENDVADLVLLCAQLGYPSTPRGVLRRLRVLIKERDHRLFVAKATGGKVVGFVHVQGRQSLIADPFAQVIALVTDEGHRGQGIARLLMDEAEKWAQDHGYSEVLLYTNTMRTDAHRFYQRIGYAVAKTSHLFHKKIATRPATVTEGKV